MRTRAWLSAVFASSLVTDPAFADHSKTHDASKDALVNYYNAPDSFRRLEQKAKSVVICTDDCEAFSIGTNGSPSQLWDAVIIFKAFMSEAVIDEAFEVAHRDLARQTLDRHKGACGTQPSDRAAASCVLKRMSTQHRLKMTRVVFDEGNKCESQWTFDLPQKLISHKCVKVTPPS
jgi:hypothetical protein